MLAGLSRAGRCDGYCSLGVCRYIVTTADTRLSLAVQHLRPGSADTTAGSGVLESRQAVSGGCAVARSGASDP